MTPRGVGAIAVVFVGFFLFLTLYDAIHNGPSFLTIVSFGVLVVLGVGIVGALFGPPDDRR